ncbi:S-adenosyl-L-methionine-dependent methyltransferase [Panaeolus papilionaceus]|nr:S-adenosyl-L-methionine-dependent methyltransferase [Panaeolus papilionaceus]
MSTKPVAPYATSASNLAGRAWGLVSEGLVSTSWGPLASLAERAVVLLLKNITVGQLSIRTDSHHYLFPAIAPGNSSNSVNNQGTGSSNGRWSPHAELRIINNTFWVRLCAMSDLGFGEAFMYGDVECDDLVSLFEVFLANQGSLSKLDSPFSSLFTLPQRLINSYRFLNTLGNTRSNISAHYDISNEMFAAFLSEDMTYSCAIFPNLDSDLNQSNVSTVKWAEGQTLRERLSSTIAALTPPENLQGSETDLINSSDSPYDSASSGTPSIVNHSTRCTTPTTPSDAGDPLYHAQMSKIQHIINKLHISEPTYDSSDVMQLLHILEIGSGWGSMSIQLAKTYPHVTVDTLTLSSAQKILAEERISERGLSDRIKVHLMDYRDMPLEWKGRFDRVVSVEMIEAVGREFLEKYWEVVDWALDKKRGVGVVQVITIPEARFEKYSREVDFIQKWVFPGGFLPSLTYLITTMTSGSSGRLVVDSISNIGPHYARTLREWRRRFEDQFEARIVPALKKEWRLREGDRTMSRDEIDVFKRKWIYYYCYCEVGFSKRILGDHIVTFAREGAGTDYGCNSFSS